MRRIKSILTTKKGVCYLCQRSTITQLHHIIHAGVSKKTQEKMGLVCYLCVDCHVGANGVHGTWGSERDKDLKRKAQAEWERKYIEKYPFKNHAEEAAREEWIRQIGRNYLD